MTCENVQNQLDDLLDGSLSQNEASVLREHIDVCEQCQQAWHEAEHISKQLRELPMIEPRPGYEQRMLAFLDQKAESGKKPRHHMPIWFGAGFATAMAAIFSVWFLFSGPILQNQDAMPIMTVELPQMQARKVDLVFNSPEYIKSASLRIELPEGTEIAGYPNRNSLEWNTSLKQGTNRLSLPLIIKAKNGGTLLAKITHQGQTRSFKVNLISTPASSQWNTATVS